MSLTIRLNGQDADGVTLISPMRDDFDELAQPLLGERIADVGLKIKPMLVIVSNDSPQTIVSISIVWRVVHQDGRLTTSWTHTSFPEFVCGDTALSHEPDAFPPGRKRIEANGVVVHGRGAGDPYYDQFLPQFADEARTTLAGAIALEIDLNAVIFADGTLGGADDDSKLQTTFASAVAAKQRWYKEVARALAAGQSVAEAFAPIDRYLAALKERRGSDSVMLVDPHDSWTQRSANEIKLWQMRHTDAEIREGIAAIRLDPFVIRRRRHRS